jgi:hypothetical protein
MNSSMGAYTCARGSDQYPEGWPRSSSEVGAPGERPPRQRLDSCPVRPLRSAHSQTQTLPAWVTASAPSPINRQADRLKEVLRGETQSSYPWMYHDEATAGLVSRRATGLLIQSTFKVRGCSGWPGLSCNDSALTLHGTTTLTRATLPWKAG